MSRMRTPPVHVGGRPKSRILRRIRDAPESASDCCCPGSGQEQPIHGPSCSHPSIQVFDEAVRPCILTRIPGELCMGASSPALLLPLQKDEVYKAVREMRGR